MDGVSGDSREKPTFSNDICETCLRDSDVIDITNELHKETPFVILLGRYISPEFYPTPRCMCTHCVHELIKLNEFIENCKKSILLHETIKNESEENQIETIEDKIDESQVYELESNLEKFLIEKELVDISTKEVKLNNFNEEQKIRNGGNESKGNSSNGSTNIETRNQNGNILFEKKKGDSLEGIDDNLEEVNENLKNIEVNLNANYENLNDNGDDLSNTDNCFIDEKNHLKETKNHLNNTKDNLNNQFKGTKKHLKDTEDLINRLKDTEDHLNDAEDLINNFKDTEEETKDHIKSFKDTEGHLKDTEDLINRFEDTEVHLKDTEDNLNDAENYLYETEDITFSKESILHNDFDEIHHRNKEHKIKSHHVNKVLKSHSNKFNQGNRTYRKYSSNEHFENSLTSGSRKISLKPLERNINTKQKSSNRFNKNRKLSPGNNQETYRADEKLKRKEFEIIKQPASIVCDLNAEALEMINVEEIKNGRGDGNKSNFDAQGKFGNISPVFENEQYKHKIKKKHKGNKNKMNSSCETHGVENKKQKQNLLFIKESSKLKQITSKVDENIQKRENVMDSVENETMNKGSVYDTKSFSTQKEMDSDLNLPMKSFTTQKELESDLNLSMKSFITQKGLEGDLNLSMKSFNTLEELDGDLNTSNDIPSSKEKYNCLKNVRDTKENSSTNVHPSKERKSSKLYSNNDIKLSKTYSSNRRDTNVKLTNLSFPKQRGSKIKSPDNLSLYKEKDDGRNLFTRNKRSDENFSSSNEEDNIMKQLDYSMPKGKDNKINLSSIKARGNENIKSSSFNENNKIKNSSNFSIFEEKDNDIGEDNDFLLFRENDNNMSSSKLPFKKINNDFLLSKENDNKAPSSKLSFKKTNNNSSNLTVSKEMKTKLKETHKNIKVNTKSTKTYEIKTRNSIKVSTEVTEFTISESTKKTQDWLIQSVHSEEEDFQRISSCSLSNEEERKRVASTSTYRSEDGDDFDGMSVTKSEINFENSRTGYEYKCDYCPCSFLLVSSLAHHKKVHGLMIISKPYLCEYCGETFMNFSKFRTHRKDHTLEQPYICLYCEKVVRGPHIYNNHIRYHTVEMGELSSTEKMGVIEKLILRGKFACGFCGKLFANGKLLYTHLFWHPDEAKLFGCGYCDKTFTQKRSLRNHELLHKEEKKLDPVKGKPNTC